MLLLLPRQLRLQRVSSLALDLVGVETAIATRAAQAFPPPPLPQVQQVPLAGSAVVKRKHALMLAVLPLAQRCSPLWLRPRRAAAQLQGQGQGQGQGAGGEK